MDSEDILDRCRYLRTICSRHHAAALTRLSPSGILEQAKQFGMPHGGTLRADFEKELMLIFELAIYMAKPGRSRAIDRYAKANTFSDPDELNVLEAMRRARFSVWRVERKHEVVGLIVKDLLRGGENWLVDEDLTGARKLGIGFASRLVRADDFSMTCGVVVPVDGDLIEDVLSGQSAWLGRVDLDKVGDDPRFASAIYRAAIGAGMLDRVVLEEPETTLA